jgi:predicted phosphodiesterase
MINTNYPEEVIAFIERTKRSNPQISWDSIARALENEKGFPFALTGNALRKRWKRYGPKGDFIGNFDLKANNKVEMPEYTSPPVGEPSQAVKVGSDGNMVATGLSKTRITSFEQLCDFFDIKKHEWTVIELTCNVWEGFYKRPVVGESGSTIDYTHTEVPIYQVKARFKPNATGRAAYSVVEEVLSELKGKMAVVPAITAPRTKDARNNTMVLSIADIHLGKLAWGEESGEDYDLALSAQAYLDAYEDLVSRGEEIASNVVYVIGNDFMHIDNNKSQTTAGTQVDSDSRYLKVFRRAVDITRKTVEDLAKRFDSVEVVFVPGNHDQESVQLLSVVIENLFAGSNVVTINNGPKLRKITCFGDNLFGFTHGDKEKAASLPLTFLTENRKLAGLTKYTYIFCGHYHTSKASSYVDYMEDRGTKVIYLPSLSPADAWHYQNGYANNRSAQAWLFNKDRGEIGMLNYNMPLP